MSYQNPEPVTTESQAGAIPLKGEWMSQPEQNVPNCPPGLEYLTLLDQVLVHQQVELFEAFTGIETKNKFLIKNSVGQQCYFAYEESDFCMRICCGPARGFMMHIVDNTGKEVIRVTRDFKCCAGCCWCADGDGHCSFKLQVESPPGNPIGSVHQIGSAWRPWYELRDAANEPVFKIKGPCCPCSGVCCTCDFPFELLSARGDSEEPVGRITKQYAGIAKEAFTDATNFSVTFPQDLDVKMKAVVIGACFLIDIMFYERSGDGDGS